MKHTKYIDDEEGGKPLTDMLIALISSRASTKEEEYTRVLEVVYQTYGDLTAMAYR